MANKQPTEEEIAEARDIVARADAARATEEAQRREAARKPLNDFVNSSEFQKIDDMARKLVGETDDPNLQMQLISLRSSLTNLRRV